MNPQPAQHRVLPDRCAGCRTVHGQCFPVSRCLRRVTHHTQLLWADIESSSCPSPKMHPRTMAWLSARIVERMFAIILRCFGLFDCWAAGTRPLPSRTWHRRLQLAAFKRKRKRPAFGWSLSGAGTGSVYVRFGAQLSHPGVTGEEDSVHRGSPVDTANGHGPMPYGVPRTCMAN
jgi:hypothetical protein